MIKIKNYPKKDILGEGGCGKVWKARDVCNKRDVAIKQVQILEQTRKYIEREKEMMQKCDHKNIITIYDAISVGSVMCFILEYCCHGDLYNFFTRQKTRISFKQCLQYMGNIASGVKYLHEMNICHRDLKPSNILVQREFDSQAKYLKVADLGLGRSLTESASPLRLSPNIGTAGWQAPELCEDTSIYSFPVDIFSLGLLVFSHVEILGRETIRST